MKNAPLTLLFAVGAAAREQNEATAPGVQHAVVTNEATPERQLKKKAHHKPKKKGHGKNQYHYELCTFGTGSRTFKMGYTQIPP